MWTATASANPLRHGKGYPQRRRSRVARLLNEAYRGTLPDASKLTVEAYLWQWLDGKHGLSPVTVERYREIIAKGIVPTLGKIELQKLKPIDVKAWLSNMMTKGSRTGGALSARTVRHLYRVLRAALGDGVKVPPRSQRGGRCEPAQA